MSVLLIAEHDNSNLKVLTLNAINAASKIDSDIHVLVAGNKCESVSKEVAAVPLVKKVLQSESANYENYLAENLTPLVIKLAEKYTHIIASANTFGKNFMPRVAALLDTSQVSDIIKIKNPDTFIRPIYAGNAFATVKSNDKKKCITIRPTSFDPAPTFGGEAQIEKIEAALRRIKEDTYGYCEETSEPIGLKRLIARPVATLSIEAQERHERDEKIFIED